MFARLNGWALPVRDRSATNTPKPWGEIGAGFLGRPHRARRALPRDLALETVVAEQEKADTLEALLDGRGHRFPFDVDAFSDAGMGPDTTASGNYTIEARTFGSSGDGVHGGGYLAVATEITWDAELPANAHTIMYWRDVAPASGAEHVVVRSDGAKWLDGVRADGTTTTELIVDEDTGAVSLSAGDYDDLVLLPFIATADFVEAFYRWTLEAGLLFAPFLDDATGRDLFEQVTVLSNTAEMLRTGGRAGGAVRATGTALLSYNASARVSANGRTAFSVEAWLRPDSPTLAADRGVLNHLSGATGWELKLKKTLSVTGVFARVRTASGDAFLETPASSSTAAAKNDVDLDAWTHVVMTWNQTTGQVGLFVNSVAVERVAGYFADFAAAPLNDALAVLRVGNNSGGTTPLVGRVSGMRFYSEVLTSAEVRERFVAGVAGVAGGLPRPFSPLPALTLSGELAGSRAIDVMGAVRSEAIVQHGVPTVGGDAGWRNNSRTIAFDLAERADDTDEALPEPIWSTALAESYLNEAGTALHPVTRGFAAMTVVGTPTWVPGPYGRGRARNFPASIGQRFALNAEQIAAVYGRRAVTVVAWVRRAAAGTLHGIAHMNVAGANTKIRLEVTAANHVQIVARGASGDAVRTVTSAGTLTETTRFHLVGGVINVFGDTMSVFLDDAGLASSPVGFFESAAAAFTSTQFSEEAAATNSILGGGAALANPWSGDIAYFAIFPDALEARDIARLWKAGIRGVLR